MKIGMDHNSGLTEAEDVALYVERDQVKRASCSCPYEIIRDEVVGRFVNEINYSKCYEISFLSVSTADIWLLRETSRPAKSSSRRIRWHLVPQTTRRQSASDATKSMRCLDHLAHCGRLISFSLTLKIERCKNRLQHLQLPDVFHKMFQDQGSRWQRMRIV